MTCPITLFRRNAPYFVASFLLLNGLNANGAPPSWWQDENYPLIDAAANPENLGIANIGQAKCMAMYALEALRNSAPMIAAQVENDLVGPGKPIATWELPVTDEERERQYAPLLLGQLKSIAAPFYTRLNATAPTWLANERTVNHMPATGTFFPWTSTSADDANRAPAAIGQLKSVFCLHFETLEAALNPDLDGDGLTNAEEAELGTDPLKADTDGDGISDFDENLAETDPFSAEPETSSIVATAVPTGAPTQIAPVTAEFRASSDGKGLPKKLKSGFGLIGRWDFEELLPPSGNLPFRFDDKAGNRAANAYGVQVSDDGMVSKSANHPAKNFSTIPASLLNNRTTYSVSFWAAVSPGSISPDKGTGLFTHHRYLNVTVPASKLTIDVNGVWLQKNGDQITLHAGSYIYNSKPNAYSPPSSKIAGISVNVASGQLDDGAFHHYVMIRSGAKTTLYVDGEKIGQATYNSAVISPDSYAGISVGRLYGLSPQISPTQPPNPTGLIGKIDRLRVWSRALTASEAASIYHQDIDEDGLWDITEARTLLWRDNNNNGIAEAGEKTYQSNPFVWQPWNSDTDDDELSDIQEQNLGTNIVNPDTDGDLLPDGWEFKYSSPGTINRANANSAQAIAEATSVIGYLDPRSYDSDADPDGDGVSNLDEYRNNTNPRKKDTDGDGTNDGVEIYGRDGNPNTDDTSDPNDAADGGNTIPATERFSVLLGVGDQSGSQSEDYILNCYHIDPASGKEVRVYTLRSGGYGQYKEETKSIFKRGGSYTFQIAWKGTNNNKVAQTSTSPADGPDFDYTFKVQPQGNNNGTLMDSWDLVSKSVSSPITAVMASDVAITASEFKEKFENKRVALVNLKVDWESVYGDASLSDHVDTWLGQANGKRWFPDQPNPNASGGRDLVGVRITGGLPNMPIWLQSLDVDDSTNDAIIDTNGDPGFDNSIEGFESPGVARWGAFQIPASELLGRASGILGASGSMLAKLRVGISAGNNYRVAATIKARSELSLLHTDPADSNQSKYVSVISTQKPTFEGAITPTLTIWRRLWLEIDTMKSRSSPPFGEEDWYPTNVTSITSGTTTEQGIPSSKYKVGAPCWDCNFSTGVPMPSYDEFENGWLINSTTNIAVPVQKVFIAPNNDRIIRVLENPGLAGSYTLLDDDDTGYPPGINLTMPVSAAAIDYPYLCAKFAPGFIEVVSANGYNSTSEVPFELFRGVLSTKWNESRDIPQSKYLWSSLAVLGYQPLTGFLLRTEDKDPDTEPASSGNTDKISLNVCSQIYVEVIRDELAGSLRNPAMPAAQKNTLLHNHFNLTIAHEIGHVPGDRRFDSHSEGGIMVDGGSSGSDTDFRSATFARFRKSIIWSPSE